MCCGSPVQSFSTLPWSFVKRRLRRRFMRYFTATFLCSCPSTSIFSEPVSIVNPLFATVSLSFNRAREICKYACQQLRRPFVKQSEFISELPVRGGFLSGALREEVPEGSQKFEVCPRPRKVAPDGQVLEQPRLIALL